VTRDVVYAVGSLGALLALFGAFLLLWRRFQSCAGGSSLNPRTRAVAWAMLLVGAALVVFAAFFAPPVPTFTP